MKRSAPIFIGAAVVAVAGLALAVRFAPSSPRASTPSSTTTTPGTSTSQEDLNPELPVQAAAVVTELDGSVSITRGKDVLPATLHMELRANDKIDLASSAKLVITWPHYGKTFVMGGSSLAIRQAFESTNRERFIVRLRLDGGRIWTHFAQPLRIDSLFDVRAGNVVVASVDGSFGMSTNGKTADVQVMQSVADMSHVTDDVDENGPIEVLLGKPQEAVARQAVHISVEGEAPGSLTSLSADDLQDPFLVAGNAVQTEADVDVAPITP